MRVQNDFFHLTQYCIHVFHWGREGGGGGEGGGGETGLSIIPTES